MDCDHSTSNLFWRLNYIYFMRRRAFVAAVLLISAGGQAASQPAPPPSQADIVTVTGSFAGKWTYRSFVDNPNPDAPPALFGRAVIELVENADGTVTGSIGGANWSLALTGNAHYDRVAATIKLRGSGMVGDEGQREFWVYDYFGYRAPVWSTGVNQRPAMVGTVVRTIQHGSNPAGFVGSFLAVRQ